MKFILTKNKDLISFNEIYKITCDWPNIYLYTKDNHAYCMYNDSDGFRLLGDDYDTLSDATKTKFLKLLISNILKNDDPIYDINNHIKLIWDNLLLGANP